MDVISCVGLTKRFGPAIVVNGLDLAVSSGQVYGFLGPNGAGKTTTIRMLLGLIAPSAGQVFLLGRRLPDPRVVAQAGSMIEEPAFYPWMTGRVNLEVLGATGGGCGRGEVARVLRLAGLADVAARKVKTYSPGMRQRLGIAAAMLGDPGVLILDEPANGLDPEGIRWMRDLLKALAAEGRTVLVSSHLLGEMQLLADDVVIVAAGKLIRQGPVDDVLGSMGAAQVRVRTPQPDQLTAALDALNATVTRQLDGALLVSGADPAAIGHAAFTASVELHELAGERGDLEQVFLQLTAGKAGIR
jgi:ABC-2 type transport system ATP-binding protein